MSGRSARKARAERLTSLPNDIPMAQGQETIVMSRADRYLDDLERMVAQGKARNDPTLAIACSVEMLDLLIREVRAAREAKS